MFTLTAPFVAKRRQLTGTFGERVRLLLEEQGKTVTALADRLGMHRVSVSRIVHDKGGDLPLSVVKGVADFLGVSVGDLID